VPAAHRLAGAATVQARELARETLAVWSGCRWLRPLEERLARAGLAPGRRLICRTPAIAAPLVEACGGIGFREEGFGIPPHLVGCGLAELAELAPVHVATKRGRPSSSFCCAVRRRP
jgi:hypothetical protein